MHYFFIVFQFLLTQKNYHVFVHGFSFNFTHTVKKINADKYTWHSDSFCVNIFTHTREKGGKFHSDVERKWPLGQLSVLHWYYRPNIRSLSVAPLLKFINSILVKKIIGKLVYFAH